jgi:hypothetical protein
MSEMFIGVLDQVHQRHALIARAAMPRTIRDAT